MLGGQFRELLQRYASHEARQALPGPASFPHWRVLSVLVRTCRPPAQSGVAVQAPHDPCLGALPCSWASSGTEAPVCGAGPCLWPF